MSCIEPFQCLSGDVSLLVSLSCFLCTASFSLPPLVCYICTCRQNTCVEKRLIRYCHALGRVKTSFASNNNCSSCSALESVECVTYSYLGAGGCPQLFSASQANLGSRSSLGSNSSPTLFRSFPLCNVQRTLSSKCIKQHHKRLKL